MHAVAESRTNIGSNYFLDAASCRESARDNPANPSDNLSN